MNSINEEKIIQQFLSELLERDLYEPIHDILAAKGYEARITHSSSELGKDLVATKPGSHNLVVSVKRGDISKPKWDTEVHPQLTQLMESPLNVNGVDESLPRRSILIVSGKLKPVVLQLLANHTDYYVSRGENPTEVWDMERLTKEIHTHLLSVALIGKEYFEDIQRLVLSIGNDSFSKIECVNFINKYLNLDKFSVFKLSFIYVLRRCEHMKNPYAFFYFAECALLNTWKYIFSKNLFSRPDEFDELHQLYMEGLENWMQTMTVALEEDYGLFDSSNGGLNEFIEYPLRVFDTPRRLSYVAFYYFLTGDENRFESITEKISLAINNNYPACKSPLCEFNYNDTGITLAVLYLSGKKELAKKWLLDIADFIIVQSLTGHRLMPLGEGIEKVTEFIISTPFVQVDSDILLLILEFSVVLNFEQVYNLIKPHIGNRLFLRAKITPRMENENQIYDKDLLYTRLTKIKEMKPTWPSFVDWFHKFALENKRDYSPMKERRPLLLILVSNIFRDRYFPDVWRSEILIWPK